MLENRTARRTRRPFFRHPGQAVVAAFAVALAIGTLLLSLPIAREGPGSAPFVTALFTATSSLCVTGLATVDTPTYWSGFGEGVILGLIQLGGFGLMTMASLLGLMISRRLGLRSRLTAASEAKAFGLGDVKRLLVGVLKATVLIEALVAIALGLRFYFGYDEPLGRAIYLGIFHGISAFNNAGFALFSDNMMGFVGDPWICLPICAAIILGGIGFPVLLELRRRFRAPRRWSLHTKLTLLMTAILLLGGWVFMLLSEWGNPGTLGPLSFPTKLLASFFHAVQPRTAGFNSLDVAAMSDETLFGTTILMFIGGGSAGTAGGIKVTTFVLLLYVIVAEVRGEQSVTAFGRRIDHRTMRQAVTVALLAVAGLVGGTMILMWLTEIRLALILTEVASALSTVGLSAGVTPTLPASAQLVLVALMFFGRLGPVTMVSALALREHTRKFEYPEERPLIG